MAPGIAPPALLRLLRQLKKGRISPGDFGRKATFVLTKDLRVSYIGHAIKAPGGE